MTAPKTEQTPGHRFRVAILEQYEPGSASDLVLLDLCAETLDECYQLAAAIERDGIVSVGSREQPVANPLLKELRAHRTAFLALAKKLEPDEDLPATRKAAAALAKRRWDK